MRKLRLGQASVPNEYGSFDWNKLDPLLDWAPTVASLFGLDIEKEVSRALPTLARGQRLIHPWRGDMAVYFGWSKV